MEGENDIFLSFFFSWMYRKLELIMKMILRPTSCYFNSIFYNMFIWSLGLRHMMDDGRAICLIISSEPSERLCLATLASFSEHDVHAFFCYYIISKSQKTISLSYIHMICSRFFPIAHRILFPFFVSLVNGCLWFFFLYCKLADWWE